MSKRTARSHKELMEFGYSESITHAETKAIGPKSTEAFLGELIVSDGQTSVVVRSERMYAGETREQVMNVEGLESHQVAPFFDCLAALIERARADGILPTVPEPESDIARRA